MQTCYLCGRNGEQVAAQLKEESERHINERIAALEREKQALSSQFGDLTAVWTSLDQRLKALNTDIFSLNFAALEKNFGNARTNLISEVTDFLRKNADFRPENFSLQDIVHNFEKYRPRNRRLEEVEEEIIRLERSRGSAAATFAQSHALLETRELRVQHDPLRGELRFAAATPQSPNRADETTVAVSVCKICAALRS